MAQLEKTPCEVFICINADGEYEVGPDADTARESFDSNIGGDGVRLVFKVVLNVPTPNHEEDGGEFDVNEPAEAGPVTKD